MTSLRPPHSPHRRRASWLGVALCAWTACGGDTAEAPPPSPPRADTTASGIAWAAAGRGPAVVLIHGTNLDRRIWSRVVERLATDRTVITYDLRSHGASRDADGPWSDLDDLAGVLDAAGAPSARLVGHSAGAGIALEFAVEHPERVDALVLVAPSVRGFRPAPGEVPDVFGPLMEALATGDAGAIGDALTALPTFVVPAPDRSEVDGVVRDNLRLFAVDPAWARSPETSPLERLDAVGVPSRVIVGTGDFAATVRLARELARALPDATLSELADAPHLLPVTDPGIVADAVRSLPPP